MRSLVLASLALLSSAPAAALQASLLVIPPDTGDVSASVHDVSADGTVLVGRTGNEAFRWTEAGGYERLGFLPDPSPFSQANAVSADGSVVVGWSNSTTDVARGFRWDATGGMVPLEPLSYAQPVALSVADAIGFGGQLIGGYSYDTNIDQGTVWLSPTAPVQVGLNAPQDLSFVFDIAAEAPVAVGTTYSSTSRDGFVWTPSTGTVALGAPNGATQLEATAVSGDGEVVFGSAFLPGGFKLVRWSATHGFEVLDGVPAGASRVLVTGVDATGRTAVGRYDVGGATTAFHWSEGSGFDTLGAFLARRGVPNTGTLTRLDPRGISADGNVIVGTVLGISNISGFVARVAPNDPAPLGVDYCGPGVPNSVGNSPTLEAFGSAIVADDDVVLSASGLPRRSFGIVLASLAQGTVPGFGGGAGTLCLGGAVGRLTAPDEIRSSGEFRRTALRLDLAEIAQPGGAAAVQPGETWNFQLWYRDRAPAGSSSNLTSGRSILFQ